MSYLDYIMCYLFNQLGHIWISIFNMITDPVVFGLTDVIGYLYFDMPRDSQFNAIH